MVFELFGRLLGLPAGLPTLPAHLGVCVPAAVFLSTETSLYTADAIVLSSSHEIEEHIAQGAIIRMPLRHVRMFYFAVFVYLVCYLLACLSACQSFCRSV